jgi:hypothetical protein
VGYGTIDRIIAQTVLTVFGMTRHTSPMETVEAVVAVVAVVFPKVDMEAEVLLDSILELKEEVTFVEAVEAEAEEAEMDEAGVKKLALASTVAGLGT